MTPSIIFLNTSCQNHLTSMTNLMMPETVLSQNLRFCDDRLPSAQSLGKYGGFH